MMNDPLQVLKKYWGYPDFRPGQRSVVDAALSGDDYLAIMPTGAGKSICFQVPALCYPGITIVISPLIALMQDQVFQLKKRGINAEAIYSGMQYYTIDRILDNCIFGEIKLLYVSPERLKSELFIERFKRMPVSLLAIDEAHCISQWGFDFRPSYLNILDLREYHPQVPLIALTATAPPHVENDICHTLQIRDTHVLKFNLSRPNLHFLLIESEEKEQKMLSLLQKTQGSAVIYCRSRALTMEISDFLNQHHIQSLAYHAGMSAELRAINQESFMDGSVRTIAATTAFGMGVDKSDVRYVYHIQIPTSPEEYFQEAGRAGRDGEDAYCVMVFNQEDIPELIGRVKRLFPPIDLIHRIFHSMMVYLEIAINYGKHQSFDFDVHHFSEKYHYKRSEVYNALFFIEKSGILSLSESVRRTSMMRIRMDKDDLYNQQIRDKNLDIFMRYILRTYEGLFIDYVKIYEEKIARDLDTTKEAIKKYLTLLDKQQVINYIPQSSEPQVTMLINRPHPDRFRIDQELYKFLKERAEERMQAMISFIKTEDCRMKVLMNYFGQEMKENCGHCDRCLGSHIKIPTAAEKLKIMKVLAHKFKESKDVKIYDLVDAFPIIFRNKVLTVISELEDENKISIFDGNRLKLT